MGWKEREGERRGEREGWNKREGERKDMRGRRRDEGLEGGGRNGCSMRGERRG